MKRFIPYFIVLLSALVICLPLFRPGLPVTHDGPDHVARIANFYRVLTHGTFVPRWADLLNWGYGHPVLMFLYPFPSYMGSAFHALGLSYIDSTKGVFVFATLASAVSMYILGAYLWGIPAGVAASMVYLYAPYRFVDLYVRGAIGEHVAFIFIPLIFYFLVRLAKEKEKHIQVPVGLSLSVAGLLLSHNAVSLMVFPLAFLYWCYLTMTMKKPTFRFISESVWFVFLGFLIAGFFWIPAVFEGKYTLRAIVTAGSIRDRFVPWSWFLFSPWNYGGGNEFSKALGFSQWIIVAIALWNLAKNTEKKYRALSMGILACLALSSIFMTSWSSLLWDKVSFLQTFQFPWRLLTINVFLVACLAGVVIHTISISKQSWLVVILCITLFVQSSEMVKAKDYMTKPEAFYETIYNGTTDTGESSPIWSIRFMEKAPSLPTDVIEGSATITPTQRTPRERVYKVTADTKTRIVENTLYFPGWNMYINEQRITPEFQDPAWRGLMTYWVDPGVHTVVFRFETTRIRTIAEMLSVTSFVLLGITSVLIFRKHI